MVTYKGNHHLRNMMEKIVQKYGDFPEFLLKYIMYQVFYAISFLHSNKVVHGDIKRENIAYIYADENKDKEELDIFFKSFFSDKEIQYELAEASGLENLSDKALEIAKELTNFTIKRTVFYLLLNSYFVYLIHRELT